MNSKSRITIKYFSRRCLSVFFFLIVGFCMIATVGRAQIAYSSDHNTPPPRNDKGELTINKGTSVEQALKRLKNYFDVVFLYRDDFITGKKVAKTMVLSGSIDKALKELLKGQPLVFEQLSYKTYGIYLREIKSKNKIADRQETVSGTVTNGKTGEPIPSVNIVVRGTNLGTTTNTDGHYSLQVSSLQDTLVFSYVGYESKVVPIGGRTKINIQLEPKVFMAEELTVIAYGKQKTKFITGSISEISSDELSLAPVANIGNALSGKLPGVVTVQSTGLPGGAAPDIFVRGLSTLGGGQSQPIFVLDGVIVEKSAIMHLNPSAVNSISVLKDATSLAVYGIKGANGAIVVETKRGQAGEMNISINTSAGIQVPTNVANIANSYNTARMFNLAQINDGVDPDKVRFSEEALKAFKTHSDPIIYPDVNWVDYITKPFAFQTQTNISFSGGTEDLRFFVSGGYLKKNGLIKNFNSDYNFTPSYSRYNLRANLDYDITPSTRLSVTSIGRIGKRMRMRINAGYLSNWAQIYRAAPYAGAGLINGKIVNSGVKYIPGVKQGIMQQFYQRGYEKRYTHDLNLQLKITQDLNFITEGLSIKVKGSYNNNFTQTRVRPQSTAIYEPYYLTDVDPSAAGDSTIVFKRIGTTSELGYNQSYGKDRSWYIGMRLNYNRDFGPHHVETLLMYNQQQDYYPFPYPGIPRSVVTTLGRVNYNYKNRYMLELAVGYNGSENFAEGNRFGFFPAISGGVILTNEPWFPDISFVNFLKLRASYGINGNAQGVGRFLYLPTRYNTNAVGYHFGIPPLPRTDGVSQGSIGNPKVTFEKSKKLDVGLKLHMFDNKMKLKVTFFREIRSDILTVPNTVPAYVAANLPSLNIGKVRNRGYEAKISWTQNLQDFSFSIGGHASYAHNTILYKAEVSRPEPYQRRTGKSVGQRFGYIYDRYYEKADFNANGQLKNKFAVPGYTVIPGDLKFKDMNDDGVINGADRAPIGYPSIPEYTFGAHLNFGYKNFHISTVWSAAAHTSRLLKWVPIRTPFGPKGGRTIMQWQLEGHWTPEKGQSATYPVLARSRRGRRNSMDSDYWMRDASYIRLKNVKITYSFDPEFVKPLGLSNLTVYLSGYNLLTFTKLKIFDPEIHTSGFDLPYPIMKIYNFGVNIDF